MTIPNIERPFKELFLNLFALAPSLLPFSDKEIIDLDTDLNQYEQFFLNPDIEKNLISKNELLASFAISKAENSTLTLKVAQDVYDFVLKNEDYKFINDKLKAKQKLEKKDYEKLEFFNIAKTFRNCNQNPVQLNDITPEYVKELHKQLTQGLDIFKDYLDKFDLYRSGNWRNTDDIRVGTYTPAPHKDIEKSVKELISWVKTHQTVTSVGIFHTALYALHPFTNGNKRVCRILEHIMLRSLRINNKNLYSTSYYYHKEKERYYKHLLASLEKNNLNYFVKFFQEALVLSIICVIKTSLEVQRKEFLDESELEDQVIEILKPLIKRNEIRFNNLLRLSNAKIARQTFITYLQRATNKGIVTRREQGRNTYYKLNLSTQEETIYKNFLDIVKAKLTFIPDDIKLA